VREREREMGHKTYMHTECILAGDSTIMRDLPRVIHSRHTLGGASPSARKYRQLPYTVLVSHGDEMLEKTTLMAIENFIWW